MNQKTKLPVNTATATNKVVLSTVSKKTTAVTKPKVVTKTANTASTVAAKKIPAIKAKTPTNIVKKTIVAPVKKVVPVETKAATKSVVPQVSAKSSKAIAKTSPVVLSKKIIKGEKKKRQKMVRDSFTMPESDYAYISALKERCLKAGTSAKKSELLRAALKCLSNLSDTVLTKAIADLEPIKTGRPAKR